MNKRQIMLNAGMAVFQGVVVGVTYFLLYAYLMRAIGVQKVGIWSVVLASTSASSVANLGLSASTVKFVAQYAARNDHRSVDALLQTALISVALFLAVLLALFYPLAKVILPRLVEAWAVPEALSLLPFAMVSVWLMVVSSVLNGGLDGYQRIDLRSISISVGTVFFAGVCYLLVKEHGLMGLAYAHILQHVAILAISFASLRRLVSIPVLPRCWDKALFKEMLGYGANFQLITVLTILFDPVTKALLSLFGGLASVGYYEMANKLVMQIRGLIVNANQVLVPAIADLVERAPGRVASVYVDSYRVVLLLAIPVFTLLAVATPVICTILAGEYARLFVTLTFLLLAGWFVNTLSNPAYFTYMGVGRLRWVSLAHVAIAVLNVGLGTVLGLLLGGLGVVIGSMVAIVVGSLIPLIAFHVEEKLPWDIVVHRDDLRLIAYSSVVVIGAALVYSIGSPTAWLWAKGGVVICTFTLMTFTALRTHSTTARLHTWLVTSVLQRPG